MMITLQDKRALVCGGSEGIGRACAIEMAKCGASVTVLARSGETLKTVVAQLESGTGQEHAHLVADSSNPAELQRIVRQHVEVTGPFHILVNNTGGPPSGPIVDATPEAFASAISNHVICNQLLAQTLLPGMKSLGYGRIINIISTSVIQPIAGLGVSNTTRGAVANWARTWAGELAPLGITVNNVLPGFTDTGRLTSLFTKKAENEGTSLEAVTAGAIDTIPMQRLGDPAELGAVVAFLASPGAGYVTGVNLPVDGGRTAIQ